MSDLVYKAERKRFTVEKLKEISEGAILTLRQYRFDESGVDNFVNTIYATILDQVTDMSMIRQEAKTPEALKLNT